MLGRGAGVGRMVPGGGKGWMLLMGGVGRDAPWSWGGQQRSLDMWGPYTFPRGGGTQNVTYRIAEAIEGRTHTHTHTHTHPAAQPLTTPIRVRGLRASEHGHSCLYGPLCGFTHRANSRWKEPSVPLLGSQNQPLSRGSCVWFQRTCSQESRGKSDKVSQVGVENDHAGPAAAPPRQEESEQASAWPGVCRRWPAERKCPRPGSAHGVPGVQTPQPSAPHKAGEPSRSSRADTTEPQPLPPASPPSPASPSCWGPRAAPPPPGPCLGLCPPSLGHAPRSGPLCRKRPTPGVRSGESAGAQGVSSWAKPQPPVSGSN